MQKSIALCLSLVLILTITVAISSADGDSRQVFICQNSGACGIDVKGTVTTYSTYLKWSGEGMPGQYCQWVKLVVKVWLRTDGGSWELKVDDESPAVGIHGTLSTQGYDQFKIKVIGVDNVFDEEIEEWMLHKCKAGPLTGPVGG